MTETWQRSAGTRRQSQTVLGVGRVTAGQTPESGLTAAMMLQLWRSQWFGLSLDFVQPAVQLPLVARGRFRLIEGKTMY